MTANEELFQPDLRRSTQRYIRRGGVAIVGTLLLVGIWACFAPLDEGVATGGVVQTEFRRKPIQHPITAVLSKVLVREGQAVKKGELLALLDENQVKANFLVAQSSLLALAAANDRMRAEKTGSKQIAFSSVLVLDKSDAAQEVMAGEERLFKSRKAALASDIAVLKQTVEGGENMERSLQAQLAGKQKQHEIVSEQITATRDLAKSGFVSRNKLLDEERTFAEVTSQIEELKFAIQKARAATAEARQRISQRDADYLREIDTRLSDGARDFAAISDRYIAAKAELQRTRLTAPSDGLVVNLLVQSEGAVVPEGAKLMEIVPQNEALIIDAQVPTELIDRIKTGQLVDVRFPGFVDAPFLAVQAKITTISADRVEETQNRPPYYPVKLALTPEALKMLNNRVVQPGMPVEIVIKTGERTMMAYLLKPLMRRLNTALLEK